MILLFESVCVIIIEKKKRERTMLAINGNKPVWVRDAEHGFLLGKIQDIGSDNFTIRIHDTQKVRFCFFDKYTHVILSIYNLDCRHSI